MNIEISFMKFKILFINTFSILYKAATLNPYKLQSELTEIKNVLQHSSNEILLPHLLIVLISLLLIAKFFLGYLSLAANIVAIFPIISDEEPEMLLPTIISQATENVLLNFIELVLGYVTCKYYISGKLSIFAIFFVKKIMKMMISVSTLNIYSDLYCQLKIPPTLGINNIDSDSLIQMLSSEELIENKSLF